MKRSNLAIVLVSLGIILLALYAATRDARAATSSEGVPPDRHASPQAVPGDSGQVHGRAGALRLLVGGTPSMPAAALPSTGAPVSVPARYSASATWCAPTPTQCQSWGGSAMFGAVFSFRDGDRPYWVHVTRGDRFADVLVVSHCACRGTDAAIDLSPAAFERLAPLSRGRIDVTVEVLSGPTVTLPPTDTPDQHPQDPPEHPDHARMRAEAGDSAYQEGVK